MQSCRSIVAVAVLAALSAGCSPSGPTRYPVAGRVSLGGQPIKDGWVFFDPDRTRQGDGPQGFAHIRDGRYDTELEAGKGAIGGPHSVRIEGKAEVDGKQMVIEYLTTADLPQSKAEQDFDVPLTAAAKGPAPGMEP